MIVLLFTSVEAAVYWIPGYFEKEYNKYDVTQAVNMSMDDLLDVTGEMMSYLRGKRDNLHVDTTMGGVEREFFNAREIAHMEDVRGLFLGALSIRRGCLMVMVLCLIIKDQFYANLSQVRVCGNRDLFFLVRCHRCHYFHRFYQIFYHVPPYVL